jgi:hypothetical protein
MRRGAAAHNLTGRLADCGAPDFAGLFRRLFQLEP